MKAHHRKYTVAAIAIALGASIAGGKTSDEDRDVAGTSSQSIERGSALYQKNCASCHGPRGKGDGKAACDLDPPPGDLTAKETVAMTDSQLFRKITNGRKPMPSFRKMLNEQERWDVVHFVRTLAARHDGEKR